MIFMSQSGLADPSRQAEWDAWYLEHLAIMAKAPRPGLSKTRLIPALGADGAATFATAR